MTTARADRLAAVYRRTLERLRAEVARLALDEFVDVDPADLDRSLGAYAERIEPILASGQAQVQALARGFIRTYGLVSAGVLVELADVEDERPIVGTTREGRSLLEGMAAWGPLVLSQIGAGKSIDEALEYGRYIAERFVDGELLGVADRETERQGELLGEITGWEGIVAPGACDGCQENAGPHELTWRAYRHGACNCEVVPIFAAAA